jgi:uncharacterized protein
MFTNTMTLDDFANAIPVFPLDGALLLPSGFLPLNIFEPRYIQMVDDALQSNRLIGITQPDHDKRDNGEEGAVMKTGCVGRITQFQETEDNRYLITLQGMIRFTIVNELQTNTPYRQFNVDYLSYQDDIVEGCDSLVIDRDNFFPLLSDYLKLNHMTCDWDMIKNAPCEVLVTTLPMVCPFESHEKQALLEAKTMDERFEILCGLFKITLNSNCNPTSKKH